MRLADQYCRGVETTARAHPPSVGFEEKSCQPYPQVGFALVPWFRVTTASCIHLLTEGILTLNQAGEWIEQTQGDAAKLPRDDNGAVLLARALLSADEITFLVGQKVNPNYQNPLLPTSMSIRKNLVERLLTQLSKLNKKVLVEYH